MGKDWFRTLLRASGYVLFLAIVFPVFIYFTFPYDRVRDAVVQQLETRVNADGQRVPTGLKVSIGDLQPYWLWGVRMNDVRARLKREGREGTLKMSLKKLHVSVNPLMWLLGVRKGTAEGTFRKQGTLHARFSRSSEETQIWFSADKLDLGKMGVGEYLLGPPIQGLLTANVELTVRSATEASEGDSGTGEKDREPETPEGTIDIRVSGLVVGDGETAVPVPKLGGITPDATTIGDLNIGLRMEKGVAHMDPCSSTGEDLTLGCSGTIRMGPRFSDARFNLLARMKFSEAYKDGSARTRSMFSLVGFSPQIKRAETKDGAYQFRVTGTGKDVRATPAANSRL